MFVVLCTKNVDKSGYGIMTMYKTVPSNISERDGFHNMKALWCFVCCLYFLISCMYTFIVYLHLVLTFKSNLLTFYLSTKINNIILSK